MAESVVVVTGAASGIERTTMIEFLATAQQFLGSISTRQSCWKSRAKWPPTGA